jgi:dihydropteroate synthase
MMFPAPDAKLYLRPVWFTDTPVGHEDGACVRLAGGLLWFMGLEIRWRGGRITLPLGQLDTLFSRLTDEQGMRLSSQFAALTAPCPPIALPGGKVLRFDQPHVMAILNVTPDSFSDGGRHAGDPLAAAQSGLAMAAAGATLIDVGGESTRPGAKPVWEGDEIARIEPVIAALATGGALVSVDTRKAAVMEAGLAAGAAIVNDVSGLTYDPRSLEVVARAGCPVILMHSPSPGDDPHGGAGAYGAGASPDADLAVFDWLEARIAAAQAAGILAGKIVVDPGIGFGKGLSGDCALINRLALFHALGVPLLLGASRKRIIGALAGDEAPTQERLGGSLAIALAGIQAGAQLVRVHDVAESVQALRVWRGLRDAALVAG